MHEEFWLLNVKCQPNTAAGDAAPAKLVVLVDFLSRTRIAVSNGTLSEWLAEASHLDRES